MPSKLEARPYGPESTPEEIQAIKDRIYKYADGIIMWVEVPVTSVFQIALFEEKLGELAPTMTSYAILIDLNDTSPPSAPVRERLRELFSKQTKMRDVAVFTGKNFMLNIAAKFVLSRAGLKKFSVHTTIDQALGALRHGN